MELSYLFEVSIQNKQREKPTSHYMWSFTFIKETVPHLENAYSKSWWGLQ